LGRDEKDNFFRDFKVNGLPCTAIFDSKKSLKQIISGEADAGRLPKIAIEQGSG
jgi:hypothetical protein